MPNGNVGTKQEAKIKIEAFTDEDFNSRADDPNEFIVSINPEKISLQRSIRFNQEDRATNGPQATQYQGHDADRLSFDIVIDSTGIAYDAETSPSGEAPNADAEVKKLLEVLYDYDGTIHKPCYLKVKWGPEEHHLLKCHCQSVNIEYNMFSASGKPLRAKLSLTFLEFINVEEEQTERQRQSPDMTHVKLVREGDSILQMCQDVYRNPAYYVEVAKLNGLSNFRTLKEGSQLLFPPLRR